MHALFEFGAHFSWASIISRQDGSTVKAPDGPPALAALAVPFARDGNLAASRAMVSLRLSVSGSFGEEQVAWRGSCEGLLEST